MLQKSNLLIIFTLLFASPLLSETIPAISLRHESTGQKKAKIFVDYTLAKEDALFQDSLQFSIADPTIKITDWRSDKPAQPIYDPAFKTEKMSYTDNGTLTIFVEKKHSDASNNAQLYLHYRLKSSSEPHEQRYTFTFQNTAINNNQTPIKNPTNTANSTIKSPPKTLAGRLIHIFYTLFDTIGKQIAQLKTMVSDLVSHTQSTTVRLFFVFLLGLLMSLTPCIYPMIPVTVGILQTTASTSLVRNFLLAFSYSIGIAATFATLGLLAASGSAHFGALMANPYFITFLVLFLGYLAFSMLGFYDMYTPKFLQSGGHGSVNGSFLSAFIFGAISGSVASPCLSPGLLLLLSIVATLGSKLLGFLYLFTFGLGLSMPLLLIGTFSNSMNILPRAGLWMVEVKKLFGFMLLSMCFYYLSNIIPWYVLLWIIGFTIFCSGLLYLTTIESYHSTSMRWFKQVTGTTLFLVGCLVFFQAYQATVTLSEPFVITRWNNNYYEALEQAKSEKKLMLVDFGATWCSSCNEIEHKILHNALVQTQLDDIIMIKVDCTNPHAEPCASIQKQFNIIGFPAILLVEPSTQHVIARWGGELLDTSPQEFITMVKTYQQ